MKGGELLGLRDLAPDVAAAVRPRLIVPPPTDRDLDLQGKLFSSDAFPDVSTALAAYWRGPVLLEATYLLDEFGRGRMGSWLPQMFDKARKAGALPTPLVRLNDLLTGGLTAYRDAAASVGGLRFGLLVSSSDLLDDKMLEQGLNALAAMGISPKECIVIADFHDADFNDPAIVAPIINGALETLHNAARWHQIVFQGTNYPEHNPAEPGSGYEVPRNDWIAWRSAVEYDPLTADHMVFGDYAADCAKLDFGRKGGAAAIRHYRYATSGSWLVQRGSMTGSNAEAMQSVSAAIVKSGKFAGRDFSAADNHIYLVSRGERRPGGAREWRAANTTHHITRVVTDIGAFRGLKFGRKVIAPEEQLTLTEAW
jgi:hypothetical protein